MRRALVAGLLLYLLAYGLGRWSGWLVFASPYIDHSIGARILVPPRVEGEAWSAVQQKDPGDLWLMEENGLARVVFGMAGWIELLLFPHFALTETQLLVDSKFLATLRVRVTRGAGPGELRILREEYEFVTLPLRAGEWSPPLEVPPDEILSLEWSQAGAVVAAGTARVPEGRHVDVELSP